MNISVICPLYNAEKYIVNLDKSIRMQKNVDIESICYVLTESKDKSEDILNDIGASYHIIKKDEFSHSLTRENQAMKSLGNIVVFITQDVIIEDNLWLYNLTRCIIDGNCEAAFSRQICKYSGMERYIRLKNYPNKSRIVSKDDIHKLGLMTFFFSDASSAVNREIFKKLNGYDNKNLIISEDMYLAYKLIMNGYRIKYCADSVVIHSHKFTCKQLFNRYFDTGVFFTDNSYLSNYGSSQSGMSLAKSVFSNSIKTKDFSAMLNMFPNFASRFIGMQLGKRYKSLPKKLVKNSSLNKGYWK
ncbi:glycosyltransferase family 2 protein [Clostridium tyrobutyricum]|uniref:glycosyltransferase family 2 protein n=1 Tax=Clostridium tyrobutyricum TaxID=1519 RepID=UPI0005801E89|nr:glycosyltransferase [Clostridium tyrobutyricum]